jgi:RNA polymerase sigma factor (sigma-70 family)
MTPSSVIRTNQQWISELQGLNGRQLQEQAHFDLAVVLHKFAFNYLQLRQPVIAVLQTFDSDELAAIAKDFVQDTLIKLTSNEYALLKSYREEGPFLNWCKPIITNLIASDLRRPFWRKRGNEQEDQPDPAQKDPENLAQQNYIQQMISDCFERLAERQRITFGMFVVEDLSAIEIAKTLGITENAVNQLVYRARRAMRICLELNGFQKDSFALFG